MNNLNPGIIYLGKCRSERNRHIVVLKHQTLRLVLCPLHRCVTELNFESDNAPLGPVGRLNSAVLIAPKVIERSAPTIQKSYERAPFCRSRVLVKTVLRPDVRVVGVFDHYLIAR